MRVAGYQLPVASGRLLGYSVAWLLGNRTAEQPSNPATQQPSRQPATGNRQLLLALLTILVAAPASACPVCFGNATGPQAEGMNNAIFFLLGVVGFVQVGFAAMFVAFWRRGRAARRHRESFRVIHGG